MKVIDTSTLKAHWFTGENLALLFILQILILYS